MADTDGTQQTTNGTADPPKEQMVPISRLNAQSAKITQLEAEIGQLRPKAQGYDAVNQQVVEWQSKAQQAQAALGFYQAAAPHGFVQQPVVDHLASAYQRQQAQVPQAQRATFDAWLGAAVQNPGGLDPVTQAVVEKHLASRSGPPAGTPTQAVSPPPTAAPGPTTPPPPQSFAPPPAPAPTTNGGIRPTPSPAAAMTPEQCRELAKDGKAFKAYRESLSQADQQRLSRLRR